MPILMSVDNPDGHKLETLLSQLQRELRAKTLKLTGNCPANDHIRVNNEAIVSLLVRAEELQRDTMTCLEALGPDEGPHGKPRV